MECESRLSNSNICIPGCDSTEAVHTNRSKVENKEHNKKLKRKLINKEINKRGQPTR